jgi:hypothetical protein
MEWEYITITLSNTADHRSTKRGRRRVHRSLVTGTYVSERQTSSCVCATLSCTPSILQCLTMSSALRHGDVVGIDYSSSLMFDVSDTDDVQYDVFGPTTGTTLVLQNTAILLHLLIDNERNEDAFLRVVRCCLLSLTLLYKSSPHFQLLIVHLRCLAAAAATRSCT